MFILDTNVISATRRPERAPEAVAWIAAQPDHVLYTSVVSWGEILHGIARQERVNAAFAADLHAWLRVAADRFGERLLPFDQQDAFIWGRLWDKLGHNGPDLMIAATALRHDCPVATRNVADFAPTGVRIVNPFDP